MSYSIKNNCFAQSSRVALLLAMSLLLGICQCNILDNNQFNTNLEIVDLLNNDSESKGDSSDNSENDLQKEKSSITFSISLNFNSLKNPLHQNDDLFKISKYRDIIQPAYQVLGYS